MTVCARLHCRRNSGKLSNGGVILSPEWRDNFSRPIKPRRTRLSTLSWPLHGPWGRYAPSVKDRIYLELVSFSVETMSSWPHLIQPSWPCGHVLEARRHRPGVAHCHATAHLQVVRLRPVERTRAIGIPPPSAVGTRLSVCATGGRPGGHKNTSKTKSRKFEPRKKGRQGRGGGCNV